MCILYSWHISNQTNHISSAQYSKMARGYSNGQYRPKDYRLKKRVWGREWLEGGVKTKLEEISKYCGTDSGMSGSTLGWFWATDLARRKPRYWVEPSTGQGPKSTRCFCNIHLKFAYRRHHITLYDLEQISASWNVVIARRGNKKRELFLEVGC